MTRRSLQYSLLGTAAIGVLSLGLAGEAHAGAKAFATLSIGNFQIFRSDGTPYSVNDFDILDVGNTTTASATYNALTTNNSVGPVPGNTDVGLQCVGPDCGGIGENNFSQVSSVPVTQDFGRGDARLAGAILTGLPVTSPATADSVAEVAVTDTNRGTGSGFVGNGTEFSFSLANPDSVTFSFDGTPAAFVALDQDAGSALARNSFAIEVRQGETTIVRFVPSELQTNLSINGRQGSDSAGPQTFSFTETTPVLDPALLYRLTITHSSEANALSGAGPVPPPVPEPATLVLLGSGLLGFGLLRRRRKSDA